MLFKAPELTVKISGNNREGKPVPFEFRGYLSQLREGVYVYPGPLPYLIESTFAKDPALQFDASSENAGSLLPVTSLSGVVVRNAGSRNLPVVPDTMPLQMQFCSLGN
jgi:hypothetical protein